MTWQGQRPLVDDLPDARHQVVAGFAQAAADHNDGRIEQVHNRGQHVTHVPSGLAESLDCTDLPLSGEPEHIRPRCNVQSLTAQFRGQRGARSERFEAAMVAATAQHPASPRHPDMAKVSGGAIRPALERTAADDARANPGSHLHKRSCYARPSGPHVPPAP